MSDREAETARAERRTLPAAGGRLILLLEINLRLMAFSPAGRRRSQGLRCEDASVLVFAEIAFSISPFHPFPTHRYRWVSNV
jgi:hypothetical protein